MTEQSFSEYVWDGYEAGRERGEAIARRGLRRFAHVCGVIDGIVLAFRNHLARVRSEET